MVLEVIVQVGLVFQEVVPRHPTLAVMVNALEQLQVTVVTVLALAKAPPQHGILIQTTRYAIAMHGLHHQPQTIADH